MRKVTPHNSKRALLKSIVLLSMIALTLLSIPMAQARSEPAVRGLAPDLAFRFRCSNIGTKELVFPIGSFLRDHGFSVANKVQISNRFGRKYYSDLDIIGLDEDGRLLNFSEAVYKKGEYSLLTYSRPPTSRDGDLERKAIYFVEMKLKCKIRELSRNKNSIEVDHIYLLLLGQTKEWFKKGGK